MRKFPCRPSAFSTYDILYPIVSDIQVVLSFVNFYFLVMDISEVINSIGLILDIIGASIMFLNTPKITHQVHLYANAEQRALKAADERTNKTMERGYKLLFLGFTIQFISNFF